jgi:hypothetical protein
MPEKNILKDGILSFGLCFQFHFLMMGRVQQGIETHIVAVRK